MGASSKNLVEILRPFDKLRDLISVNELAKRELGDWELFQLDRFALAVDSHLVLAGVATELHDTIFVGLERSVGGPHLMPQVVNELSGGLFTAI